MKTALALIFLFSAATANADIISEAGVGIKNRATTSIPLLPECHTVDAYTETGAAVRDREASSCGGDNPAFVGWPIAWEREFTNKRRLSRVRCGWFHFSHWGDGGSSRETHMDLGACTLTIRWTTR